MQKKHTVDIQKNKKYDMMNIFIVHVKYFNNAS